MTIPAIFPKKIVCAGVPSFHIHNPYSIFMININKKYKMINTKDKQMNQNLYYTCNLTIKFHVVYLFIISFQE